MKKSTSGEEKIHLFDVEGCGMSVKNATNADIAATAQMIRKRERSWMRGIRLLDGFDGKRRT